MKKQLLSNMLGAILFTAICAPASMLFTSCAANPKANTNQPANANRSEEAGVYKFKEAGIQFTVPAGAANAVEAADLDSLAGVFQQAVGATPENLTGAFTRVLLGVRLNCAQCHDHPFTDWKQRDFWGLAAFFQATTGDAGENARPALTIRPRACSTGQLEIPVPITMARSSRATT